VTTVTSLQMLEGDAIVCLSIDGDVLFRTRLSMPLRNCQSRFFKNWVLALGFHEISCETPGVVLHQQEKGPSKTYWGG